MKYKFQYILLSTIVSCGSNQQHNNLKVDIDPNGKMGKLQVNFPQNQVTPIDVTVFHKDRLDEVYQVKADRNLDLFVSDQYCLMIKNGSYYDRLCNISIVNNQTTQINLSQVTFTWDANRTNVDLGDTASFALIGTESRKTNFTAAYDRSGTRSLVLIEGAFEVRDLKSKNIPNFEFKKTHTISTNAETKLDITPTKDMRIKFNLSIGANKFSKPQINGVSDNALLTAYNSGNSAFASKSINLYRSRDIVLPLTSWNLPQGLIELSVNGTRSIITNDANTVNVELRAEPINVNHINVNGSLVNGQFELYHIGSQAEASIRSRLITTAPTGSTVYVADHNSYKIRTFIRDKFQEEFTIQL